MLNPIAIEYNSVYNILSVPILTFDLHALYHISLLTLGAISIS